jgi:PAS domain S-box-containing protein
MPHPSQTPPPSGPLTLLLVSDQAEDIKHITITIRAFYPGSRVETVYTPEDALEWASKQEWTLILLDESLPGRTGLMILPELRKRALTSAILLQTDRVDTAAALEAIKAGADFIVFKTSPAFLTELPLVAREVLEKRDLRMKLDLSDRYRQLIEDLTDFVYELDRDGRFVYVSPGIVSLLGYSPEELIGLHYSTLLQPTGSQSADQRLDERRTGPRATRNVEVRLVAKTGSLREAEVVELEMAAAGLYSRERQFLGSIGVARDITRRKRDEAKLERLQQLGTPLTSLLNEAAQLMARLRGLQIEQQLELMGSHAARLADFGKDVLQAIESPVEETKPATSTQPVQNDHDKEPPAGQNENPTATARPPDLASSDGPCTESESSLPNRGVTQPTQERRRDPRIDLELEARLRMDEDTWDGRVVNMALGGLYMVFNGSLEVAQDQPIQLGLGGEGGILEIRGRVCAIRAHTDPQRGSEDHTATGLAVEFANVGSVEERILGSILEGLRERALNVKLTALLIPQETKGLLVEAHSDSSRDQQPSRSTMKETEAAPTAEHRMAARVNVVMPVSIAAPGASLNAPQGMAQTSNLSVGGVCVLVQRPSDLLGRRILLRLSPPAELFGLGRQDSGDMAFTVMGEVVWAAPDAERSGAGAVRMGVRFLHLKEETWRRITALVGQLLTMPGRVEPWGHETGVVSELSECQSLRGQRIVFYYDHAGTPLPPAAPAVILSPGYGETKREYIALAYAMATNGCHVFRYDHSNHVGESEGDLSQTTLSGMKDDLTAVLAHVERMCPASPVAVVATDLSARAALKASAHDPRIKLLIILAGVVDVQATLIEVHQEDYIGTFAHGTRRGVCNILGLNIDADRWLADASKQGYADLRTTLRDTAQIRASVVWFVAEHDAWVRESSVKEVQAALDSKLAGAYSMPAPLPRLRDEAKATRETFDHIVRHCRQQFYPLLHEVAVLPSTQGEIVLQKRLESERARALHQMGTAESIEFWRDYLAQFHYIANFPDYWHLLEQVYGLIGASDKQERILDAGCGNGNFGMFLLINKAYRQQISVESTDQACQYVGLDFVAGALTQTRRNLDSVFEDLQSKFPPAVQMQPLLTTSLVLADLNVPLPFRSGQFAGIVCNLVIGYLQDPLFALRELLRVLAPKGRIVLTNLKPDADLTQIYRNFIPFAKPAEELDEAKQILATTAKIQRGQREGIFRSFDRHALARLLMTSGAVQPRIYSAFANQAFIVVAEKAPH